MGEERRAKLLEDGGGLARAVGRIRRDAGIQRLALAHRGVERAHGLFEWGLGVEAVRIKDVHVLQAHALQALVEARQQVLARAPNTVRARPHVVTGLGRDHELIAVAGQVGRQDPAEVLLGRAVRRAVVVGQVELGDPQVERTADDRALALQRDVAAKVLPQAERDRRQLEPAAAAAAVLHARVAVAAVSDHLLLNSCGRPDRRCGGSMRPGTPTRTRRAGWPRRRGASALRRRRG